MYPYFTVVITLSSVTSVLRHASSSRAVEGNVSSSSSCLRLLTPHIVEEAASGFVEEPTSNVREGGGRALKKAEACHGSGGRVAAIFAMEELPSSQRRVSGSELPQPDPCPRSVVVAILTP
jgi:hypothetical protein